MPRVSCCSDSERSRGASPPRPISSEVRRGDSGAAENDEVGLATKDCDGWLVRTGNAVVVVVVVVERERREGELFAESLFDGWLVFVAPRVRFK